jgi:hypothetical protein
MEGRVAWLVRDELMDEAAARAVAAGWDTRRHAPTREQVRDLVADTAEGEQYRAALADQAQWDAKARELSLRRWQREKKEEQKHERERKAAAEKEARRRRKADEALHEFLTQAGLVHGQTESRIARLLMTRYRHPTADQLRSAVQAYENAYEARIHRYRETGGQTPWPTPDAIIDSLFGPK